MSDKPITDVADHLRDRAAGLRSTLSEDRPPIRAADTGTFVADVPCGDYRQLRVRLIRNERGHITLGMRFWEVAQTGEFVPMRGLGFTLLSRQIVPFALAIARAVELYDEEMRIEHHNRKDTDR